MSYFFKSILIALQNIKANPLHTFLSTLGIIIGVASLVGILALGDGLEQTGREQLATTTSLNIVTVSSNSTKIVDDIRIQVEDRPTFTYEHVFEVENYLQNEALIELTSRRSMEISNEDSSTAVYVQGTMQYLSEFITDTLSEGRFIELTDITQKNEIVLISYIVAEKLGFSASEAIGKQIELAEGTFEIVGVLEENELQLPFVYIPISVFQEYVEIYPTLTLRAELAEKIPEIEENLANWLDQYFEQQSEAFTISSNRARVEQFSRGILLFKLIMGAITGISVLVGGIGVMNVLLISVTERTKEIGVRKATGAKKKDIILQFMSESVTISIVGAAIGWLVGIIGISIFVPIVNNITEAQFNAAVRMDTALLIFILATIIGVVFGTYPAWRAAQLDPIDAIRHE